MQVCEDVCHRMRMILESQRAERHVSDHEEQVHLRAIQVKYFLNSANHITYT